MVLAADIAIASEKVKFSESFGNVGLTPGLGGTYLLPRLVGLAKAKELVFTCRTLDAKEALELGIIYQVVPPEVVFETAYALAEKIAAGPTFAIAMAKRMMNRSFETDLHAALHMEALSEALAGNSRDHAEGVAAFFEKRPRKFTGE
jgi:2-(1,2-epoxy-1,2-dihydrophenyl)acetyl-CoA isomerase